MGHKFQDGIYVPWTFGLVKLQCFHEWLNSRLPGSRFTMSYSSQGIIFLDTYIYMKNGQLYTKPFSKSCDDHTFLVRSSCHLSHNLPYSIGHRLYRTASEPAEYEISKQEFTEHLKARGYSTQDTSHFRHHVLPTVRDISLNSRGRASSDNNLNKTR